MLKLAYARVDALPPDAAGLPLSEYRRQKLAALKPAAKRRQSLGAELLLIRMLRELEEDLKLPLRIRDDENGKPYLSGSKLHFSLSHSGPFVACAVSDRPVGVDIQKRGPCRASILRRCMTDDEQAFILSSPDPESAFIRIWTGKESYGKALGIGLQIPLREVSVLQLPGEAALWHRASPEFQISLCTLSGKADPDSVREIRLP